MWIVSNLLSIHKVSAALSCSITTAAACTSPSTIVLRMSAATNAHSELASQSTAGYASNVVCCGGLTGISNSCSGTFAVAAKLSAVTNAHIEQNTLSAYTNNACLSVPSGTVTIGYQNTNCTGFDTTLASMTNTTNSTIGSPASYTIKICGTLGATTQSLTFSISDNSVGFGPLSSGAARFATGDTLGSATEVEAHQLSVSTNAASGYSITVQGATLTASPYTITAIGGTNTASSAGSEQFGLRMSASGGVGTVVSPYAAAGFAYAGGVSTPSQVGSATSGTGVATVYSVRYVANVAATTEPGSYNSSLVYVATANF
ncbi:MAG: hypothetical protein JWL80_243 [Parcubacteria group bacterium]|nr:hypothetical protein [Parcubacteria group bacterium]